MASGGGKLLGGSRPDTAGDLYEGKRSSPSETEVRVVVGDVDDEGLQLVTLIAEGHQLVRAQVDPQDARTWWCIAFRVETEHGIDGIPVLRSLREQLGLAMPVWGPRDTQRADRMAIAA